MHPVDSTALANISNVLGIGDPPAGALANFDEENLQQTLVVNPFVRRARSIFGSEGLFSFSMQADHAAAGVETDSVSPYAAGSPQNAYQSPLPDHLEVWLLACALRITAGTEADFDGGVLHVFHQGNQQAFGVTGRNVALPVARWVSASVLLTGQDGYGLGPNGELIFYPRFRLRPDNTLVLITEKSNVGAMTIVVDGLIGVTPRGLGQDGVA